ncbi:MAG: hypothetical protein F7C08_01925 [Desulfurococcales archaeon]|nr:hypothetical protein [Desulfurococcales archaeon]MCE4605276.1 hypothetical protein [Desulfurococcales archaeon]
MWGTVALLLAVSIGVASSMAGFWEYRVGGGVCDLSSWLSCSRVYYLPEAKIAGIHLSEAAPLYFMLLAGLAAMYGFTGSRKSLVGLALASLAGLAIVPYLVYLEVFRAGAICIFCTLMHISIIASAFLSYRLLRS